MTKRLNGLAKLQKDALLNKLKKKTFSNLNNITSLAGVPGNIDEIYLKNHITQLYSNTFIS